MNFASLLKMHENRQQPNFFGNQFMINCNRKNDNPSMYGGFNYTGAKKRLIQPMDQMNQSLLQIYSSFEENPNVQYIIQLQSHNVKIHKFKPSKIKAKKDEHVEINEKFQPRLYPQQQQRHFVNPITKIVEENHQNQTLFREKKNYSPMQQMKTKNFTQDQNWMENLNQNKFSFGEDSQQVSEGMEQNLRKNQEFTSNDPHMQQNQDEKMNTQNQSYIEERQQYEVQERQNDTLRGKGVNLFKDFEKENDEDRKFIQRQGEIQNQDKISKEVNKMQVNQKNQEGFNPNVGFSFEEIDKINQNHPQSQQQKYPQKKQTVLNLNLVTPGSQNQQKNVAMTERNERRSSSQLITENQQAEEKITKLPGQQKQQDPQKTSNPTSLTVIINKETENKINENKFVVKQENKNMVTKKAETQPNQQLIENISDNTQQDTQSRIYCRANVRTLTPQKFKYPRIESKIQSNSNIQPFSTDSEAQKATTATIPKTEKNIKAGGYQNSKVQNVQSQKLIIVPSSDRLLALIDESKRLLQSRNVNNDEKKAQDRIKRIVLHQPEQPKIKDTKVQLKDPADIVTVKNDTLKVFQEQKKNTEPISKSKEKTNVSPQQGQAKKVVQNLTPRKSESPKIQQVSSPKSPLQQKPKFFNQLANVETNYNPQITNVSPNLKNTQISTAEKQLPPTQFTATTNVQANMNNDLIKNTSQKNYSQNNYTYKPLHLPPHPPKINEQKDNSVYKPQSYKANLSPYQPTLLPYQPTVQPYTQFTENMNIHKQAQPPQLNENLINAPQVKTYSPYFPINNTNAVRPPSIQQNKSNQVYQTYTYNGFSTSTAQQQQFNPSVRPLGSNEPNNYIKINTNYVSPLENNVKTEQKDIYQMRVIGDVSQKENLKPVGLGIDGIKCVESKIYDPTVNTNIQIDPKQTSIEFSLRIEEHFHLGTK